MLSFDSTTRISVAQALEHPWLAAYHDVNDEPACSQNFDRWREIEALQTVEELRAALWDEINDFRREVRAVGAEADEQPSSLPSEIPLRSLSAPSEAPLSPQREDLSPAVARSRQQSASNSPLNERRTSMDERARPRMRTRDPVVSYARRTSTISVRDRDSAVLAEPEGLPVTFTRTPPEDEGLPPTGSGVNAFPFPSSGPPEGYVVPARQRTNSVAGGPTAAGSRLLRTLSTVSIHETADAGIAAEVARLNRAKETGADAPASEMPKEIGGERDESGGENGRS
jgi:mitogen-activated protein kinase 7